jgi:hypothetical protein
MADIVEDVVSELRAMVTHRKPAIGIIDNADALSDGGLGAGAFLIAGADQLFLELREAT